MEEKIVAAQIDLNQKVLEILEKHSDMVRRICFVFLRNKSDVEDIFQNVFMKLLLRKISFENDEHEKAWLIRVAINECQDLLKSFWQKNINIADYVDEPFKDKDENELLQVVLSLPQKYKEVIYLYYYEGYTVPQMSKILKRSENTLYSHLHRAKKLIRKKLEGKEDEYSF